MTLATLTAAMMVELDKDKIKRSAIYFNSLRNTVMSAPKTEGHMNGRYVYICISYQSVILNCVIDYRLQIVVSYLKQHG